MDRDTLTRHMHRAGQQWAVCCSIGDYDEAARLAAEIEGYNLALTRLDAAAIPESVWHEWHGDAWDILKGSPEHG